MNMTLSEAKRLADVDRLMRVIMERVGDNRITDLRIDRRDDPDFEGFLPTTWSVLERESWIVQVGTPIGHPGMYKLTDLGWLKGLERAGELGGRALRERLVKLIRFMKAHLDGREDDALVGLSDLEGLPSGWIANVINSRLLRYEFPDRALELSWWDYSSPRGPQNVRVPRDFGTKKLRL
jgi:hypothetical protein